MGNRREVAARMAAIIQLADTEQWGHFTDIVKGRIQEIQDILSAIDPEAHIAIARAQGEITALRQMLDLPNTFGEALNATSEQ